jgi:hypothetical protein
MRRRMEERMRGRSGEEGGQRRKKRGEEEGQRGERKAVRGAWGWRMKQREK